MFDIKDAQALIYENIAIAEPLFAIKVPELTIPAEIIQIEFDKLREKIAKTTPTIKQTALNFAFAEYKKGVKEIPKGSNTSPEIRMYQENLQWLYKKPWCGSFVTWCTLQATKELHKQRFFEQSVGAAVLNLYRWGYNNEKCFNAKHYTPEPGDIFLMLNETLSRGIHTGFVKEYFPEKEAISTIEGNYDDRIASCMRQKTGDIKFYLKL